MRHFRLELAAALSISCCAVFQPAYGDDCAAELFANLDACLKRPHGVGGCNKEFAAVEPVKCPAEPQASQPKPNINPNPCGDNSFCRPCYEKCVKDSNVRAWNTRSACIEHNVIFRTNPTLEEIEQNRVQREKCDNQYKKEIQEKVKFCNDGSWKCGHP